MARYDVSIKIEWSGEIEASSESEAKENAIGRVCAGGGDNIEFDVWGIEHDDDTEDDDEEKE